METTRRLVVRLGVLLAALTLVAVVSTWAVVSEGAQCRWTVSVWDGDTVRAGALRVPCDYSEAQVRAELAADPPPVSLQPGEDWDARR